jgi:2-dehydro-3-deoxyglucarate aldolase
MHNSLKKRLAAGRTALGSWITLAHPGLAEIMARSGFDWLAVDMEHSVITIREAEELIRVIGLCGAAPLVRLSWNDHVQIKRVMDAGAHGVIAPMINTPAEAAALVAAVHYPPRGTRGVGLARAQGYGAGFADYKNWLAENALVIVQVEHIRAVENLAAILDTPGVDGFLVGPYDLSGSLGRPGDFEHPDFLAAMARIREAAAARGALAGIHVIEPDPAALAERLDQGYRFVAYSLDIRMLDMACRTGVAVLKDREQ